MSKERKDNTSKKIVKIVIWLLVMTATALVIWKLYGKIDIKRTDFSKVTVKKQPSTIYDMYKVKSEKIASVKSVVGERKIKTYSKSNQGVQILKLTFIDNDSENTVKEYMNYLKDNGNYIEMNMSESNKRKIANPSKELITVETEIIEGGFILTIEVGPGSIKVNNPE